MTAALQLAKEHLVRERVLNFLLNQAAQWSCAEIGVIALLGESLPSRGAEFDLDLSFRQLRLEFNNELADDLFHHVRGQGIKAYDLVQTIAKLGAEDFFDLLVPVSAFAVCEPNRPRRHFPRTPRSRS